MPVEPSRSDEFLRLAENPDAINAVARALYRCESERSDHVDKLLSAAKGQPVRFRMEHWDDVADLYRSDARAALRALAEQGNEHGSDWFNGDVDADGNELVTIRADELQKLRDNRLGRR